MRLLCLGTTGYHPSPSRHTACYYLPDQNLVLDAGTGLFRLTEHLLREPKDELDIVLSHAHLDHVIGLTFLLDVMAVTTLKRVRVFGQQDKLHAVESHLFHPLLFPVPASFEMIPLEGSDGLAKLTRCEVEYFPLDHPGGSIGMVVQSKNQRLAYITDTTPQLQESFVERIREVDLLMHECYFSDKYQALSIKTGHSWLSAVTEIVKRSQPKQTVLIHINPLAEVVGGEAILSAEHLALRMQFADDNSQFVI